VTPVTINGSRCICVGDPSWVMDPELAKVAITAIIVVGVILAPIIWKKVFEG